MRILYAATGALAIPLLEALHREGLVCAVLTAPDAPGKRGKSLVPTPVKARALELGLEVWQPETLRTEAREHARGYEADLLLSFCYGKIFGPRFLALFRHTMNVHPSLLPLYRGPSPCYEAVRNRDRVTGITVQEIAPGIDEGDIYLSRAIELDGTETTESLEELSGRMAPDLVLEALSRLDEKTRQEGTPSYSHMLSKEDGLVDFSRPWQDIHAQVRAAMPWPKAYTTLDGETLYITGVGGSVFDEAESAGEEPGTVVGLVKRKGLKVACAGGYLYITRLLPPKRKEMDAASYVNGRKDIIGRRLGT